MPQIPSKLDLLHRDRNEQYFDILCRHFDLHKVSIRYLLKRHFEESALFKNCLHCLKHNKIWFGMALCAY